MPVAALFENLKSGATVDVVRVGQGASTSAARISAESNPAD